MIDIEVGTKVIFKNEQYVIKKIISLQKVLLDPIKSGEVTVARYGDLYPWQDDDDRQVKSYELAGYSKSELKKAKKRKKAILPLLEKGDELTEKDVEARSKDCGVSRATLYRWLRAFRMEGRLSSLVPSKPGVSEGTHRLGADQEAILQDLIEEEYLTKNRRSISFVIKELKSRCKRAEVSVPGKTTIYRRIAELNEEKKVSQRYGADAAKKFSRIKGSFPGADYALSVVQFDHTPGNIILVDDVDRLPIGRPWVTLGICVYTRMVTGYYISFEAPSALSVGMCVSRSILPKVDLMNRLGSLNDWPVLGVMREISADNGKDFKSKTLQKACDQYTINLSWRPVKKPEWGGHIERLMGITSNFINDLPGTTKSNIQARAGYDSEANAVLTLDEFELMLVEWITGTYHQDVHTGIGMPPIKKYEQSIFGDDNQVGRGFPQLPEDPEQLKLDFLPYFKRTIQRYGVALDGIEYSSDVLRSWIGSKKKRKNRKKPKVARKFIFRRDPRTIGKVFFWDPELKSYFSIPYANAANPVISLWELKAAKKRLAEEGITSPNEDAIFRSWEKMREIENTAKKKTKAARKNAQRKASGERAASTIRAPEATEAEQSTPGKTSSRKPRTLKVEVKV